jgi:hypothetical protein
MLKQIDLLLTHPYVLTLQEKVADVSAAHVALATLAFGAAVVAIDYGHMLYLRSKMPPGPFPLPIVGNTLSLPQNKPWLLFEELSKKYKTPVITFWVGRYVLPCRDDAGSKITMRAPETLANPPLMPQQEPNSLDQRCLERARNSRKEGPDLLITPTHGRLR